MPALRLDAAALPPELDGLRRDVRAFLADEIGSGRIVPYADNWLAGWDPAFSRRLGERGWIGMTFPREYGGGEAGSLARFVVTEELLAAGAPVAAHWIADRQSGPSLLKFGTEEQRRAYLPGIARGETSFAIGMSEPDSGSDLASVRTKAVRADGGWTVDGTKVWTSGAHVADAMIALVRTGPAGPSRHEGLTQLIVDLSAPGVHVRPIRLLTGEHHFNEVVLDGAFVPDGRVLGTVGDGWRQVTSELSFERSGPERILSTFPLLAALAGRLAERGADGADGGAGGVGAADRARIGTVVARLWALRRMSLAVAARLAAGDAPATEAAVVKDLGTRFEGALIETVRLMARVEPGLASSDPLAQLLAQSVLHAPGFTLRGGTNEILRGVVAKSVLAREGEAR